MKTTRLLLPFTYGVNMDAIEHAVLLAKGCSATLVPVALIYIPEGPPIQGRVVLSRSSEQCHPERSEGPANEEAKDHRARGARLEHIQQSKDFLEATKYKAMRYGVPIERFEIFTSDVVQSIIVRAQQMACNGIILFIRGEEGLLLRADEIEHLIEMGAHRLYVIRLPSKPRPKWFQMLLEHLWLPGRGRRKEKALPMQPTPQQEAQPEGALSSHSDSPDLQTPARS
jgi:hypothetical protein